MFYKLYRHMLNLLDIIIREMKLRNYSPKTIEAYLRVIKDIYAFYGRSPRDLSEEEIKNVPPNHSLIRANRRMVGKCWGFSREYKRVVFPGKNLIGQVVNIKINKVKEWELEGEVQY